MLISDIFAKGAKFIAGKPVFGGDGGGEAPSQPVITYSVIPSSFYVEEGTQLIYTVTTSNIADGTVLYWTNIGTAGPQDFVENTTSGSFVVNNNTASIVLTVKADNLTDPGDIVLLQIRTGSNTGPVVKTSQQVLIADTSGSPLEVEYLVVGGGGGGGQRNAAFNGGCVYTHWLSFGGGGGGGGGFVCGTNLCINGCVPIIVGSGGARGYIIRGTPTGVWPIQYSTPGGASCIGNQVIAQGGGRGGHGRGGASPFSNGGGTAGTYPTAYYDGPESTRSYATSCGYPGGSGGGAGSAHYYQSGAPYGWYYFGFTQNRGLGTPTQGNPGGTSNAVFAGPYTGIVAYSPQPYGSAPSDVFAGGGGGGGGACTAGQPAWIGGGGNGGQGCQWEGAYYSGGGGGGATQPSYPSSTTVRRAQMGEGGLGGGARGGIAPIPTAGPAFVRANQVAANAAVNTGGGGGGMGFVSGCAAPRYADIATFPAGSGGSGIVIIRYPLPQRAVGGVIYCCNGKVYHEFKASCVLQVCQDYSQTCVDLDLLLVGGGAGGGNGNGGGGGAGAFICAPLTAQTSGTLFTITIGAGGTGCSPSTNPGKTGGDTSVVAAPKGICLISKGGGYGGSAIVSPVTNQSFPATTGGSGGGSSGWSFYHAGVPIGTLAINYSFGSAGPAGTCIGSPSAIGYTSRGGAGISAGLERCTCPFTDGFLGAYWNQGGGGGGAGGEGRDTNLSNPESTTCALVTAYVGRGGPGRTWIDGRTYAGGGGGSPGSYGGSGGGGRGSCCGGNGLPDVPAATPICGALNSGSGGGGSCVDSYRGGNGGSGIVVFKYAGSVCKATGGVVCVIGGDTYHYFCSSGTLQII